MNDFESRIKAFGIRAKEIKDSLQTEEATKTSLVLPFFNILGYDIFNPTEFVPEFTADIGIKKGEKVDYAILLNNIPSMLIECKSVNEPLTKHDSQLFRYFSTLTAKFAILTNGIIYRFFTDLEESNKMDEKPFLEINITSLKDNQISELKKFHKENFDLDNIKNTASDLKYLGLIRETLSKIFNETPDDEFTKFILNSGVYEGVKTQNIIDKYRPLVKKSIALYVNDLVNEKIQSALNSQAEQENEINSETVETDSEANSESQIVTTEEELQSYYIVKSILRGYIDINRITYKDTISYFGINIDNKVTKWLCRIVLKENIKYVLIKNENDETEKFVINNIDEIYNLEQPLLSRLKKLNVINVTA
ncbi:type I restriction endonuclease [Peptoanaerobacter stomatis]|uniref:type I restriction endonuclease n=1 Tax=Peptoanaerobacter stomatis TaxID=796937 RepID=UPI003FA0351D